MWSARAVRFLLRKFGLVSNIKTQRALPSDDLSWNYSGVRSALSASRVSSLPSVQPANHGRVAETSVTAPDSCSQDVIVPSSHSGACLMATSVVQTAPPTTVEVSLSSCTTGDSLRPRQSQRCPRVKMQPASDPGEVQSAYPLATVNGNHSSQHCTVATKPARLDAQSPAASPATLLPNTKPVWTLQGTKRSTPKEIPGVCTAASSSHHPVDASDSRRRTPSDAVVPAENAEVLQRHSSSIAGI